MVARIRVAVDDGNPRFSLRLAHADPTLHLCCMCRLRIGLPVVLALRSDASDIRTLKCICELRFPFLVWQTGHLSRGRVHCSRWAMTPRESGVWECAVVLLVPRTVKSTAAAAGEVD